MRLREKKEKEDKPRNLTTVEWMTALTLGCAGVPMDKALELAGVVRSEYGSLIPNEENVRRLVAEVLHLKEELATQTLPELEIDYRHKGQEPTDG